MRVALFALGCVGVIVFAPLTLIAAVFLSARYRAWEVIVLGLAIDIMWLSSGVWKAFPIATCITVGIVWAFEPFRRKLLLS